MYIHDHHYTHQHNYIIYNYMHTLISGIKHSHNNYCREPSYYMYYITNVIWSASWGDRWYTVIIVSTSVQQIILWLSWLEKQQMARWPHSQKLHAVITTVHAPTISQNKNNSIILFPEGLCMYVLLYIHCSKLYYLGSSSQTFPLTIFTLQWLQESRMGRL